ERQAARGQHDAAGARAARVLQAGRQHLGDAKRLAIRDVAGVHVHRDELAPRRRPAEQMTIEITEAASAGERPGIDVAAVWPLDDAHRLKDIARVRYEQMKLRIVRGSPEVDPAGRPRR